jgi:PAS domain S-box-containing protein
VPEPRSVETPEEVNLLLVDDRPANLLALQAILELPGYRLVNASSGPEALEKVAREDFALILLDVAMPEMTGFDVADRLKKDERTRSIPILFLTAVATGLDEIYRAYKIGAVDYLIKPLNVDAVRSKVAVFADLYRQRREIERRDERLREAQRKEDALRLAELRVASDARYQKLVEGIDHAFSWTADRGGHRLSFVSRRASELLGYAAEEFLRDGFFLELVHPDDREATSRAFAAACAAHDQTVNHRLVTAADAVRWFHTAVSCGREPGTNEFLLHGLTTDVTDLKAAEERQRRLARENARLYEHSARAADARDEVLRVVSHDLRDPLGSVLLGLDTACASLSDDPARAKQVIEAAQRNARTMARLVDDLLDRELARVGRLSLDKAPHDVVALLRDAASMVEAQARARTVEVRVPDTVATNITSVVCDRDRVLQILSNLLGNAIKFSPAGGHVLLGARREKGEVLFAVTDEGPGIDPAKLPHVFERMWQGEPKARGGLGLGLSIARGLVQAHEGRIWAESTPGKGSTFFFTLPLGNGGKAVPAAPTEASPAKR